MIASLKQIFRSDRPKRRSPSVPEGERIYAVGDIHGRLDLFKAIVEAIETDDAECGPANTTVILLGDLVDRGPDSAGVVSLAREWGAKRTVRYLAGNHEEMFLESFTDLEMLRHFVKHGGRETILSYGLPRKRYNSFTMEELQQELHQIVPQEDREFLSSFDEIILAGDYAFVHAGIDPNRPIDEQRRSDMLWIRERFLRHEDEYSHVVVHGHTIFEDIEERQTRIGIDTGAFRTGRLTALALEGESRRYIQATEQDGEIVVSK